MLLLARWIEPFGQPPDPLRSPLIERSPEGGLQKSGFPTQEQPSTAMLSGTHRDRLPRPALWFSTFLGPRLSMHSSTSLPDPAHCSFVSGLVHELLGYERRNDINTYNSRCFGDIVPPYGTILATIGENHLLQTQNISLVVQIHCQHMPIRTAAASFCDLRSRSTRIAAFTDSSLNIPPGRPPGRPPPFPLPLPELEPPDTRAWSVGEPGSSRSTAQIILPARHLLLANCVFKASVSPSSYDTLRRSCQYLWQKVK